MTVIYICNEADNNDLMYAVAAANDGNYSYFFFFFFFLVSKINDNIIIKPKTYLHAYGAGLAQPV